MGARPVEDRFCHTNPQRATLLRSIVRTSPLQASNILEAKGVCCIAARKVSVTVSMKIDIALLVVSEWLNDLRETDTHVNGVTMVEAFTLTLSMKRIRKRHPTNHFLSMSEFLSPVYETVFSDGGLGNNVT